MPPCEDKQIIISYTNLRRLIGVLGIGLPFMCLTGLAISATELQPSISHCYYTNNRDVFVGIMLGVSMFLITYYGYGPIDNIITNVTGIAGVTLALCPCLFSFAHPEQNLPAGYFSLDPYLSTNIHLVSASLFFLLLAFNSIFLFTKTNSGTVITENKKKRNVIYVVCGVSIIAGMIALAAVYFTVGPEKFDEVPVGFVLESFMLVAFGISWLVKGDTIYRD